MMRYIVLILELKDFYKEKGSEEDGIVGYAELKMD